MPPADSQLSRATRPRVGIPWRTSEEEGKARRAGPNWKSGRTEDYRRAVERAGGEAVLVPLKDQEEQGRLIPTLDAFVLPGSSADIDPVEYQGKSTGKSLAPDRDREHTDRAILDFAFANGKPVLAVCYGVQMLNVYQGGSLFQDIPKDLAKRPNAVPHGTTDIVRGTKKDGDQYHDAVLTEGSILAKLAESSKVHINSRHHQAIDRPGEKLRVTAQAPDGVIEAVEWTGDSNWVVGVQWHPERMPDDPFAQRLFQQFVAAARARETATHR
jgi:putative glutamine amidotransferase